MKPLEIGMEITEFDMTHMEKEQEYKRFERLNKQKNQIIINDDHLFAEDVDDIPWINYHSVLYKSPCRY